MFDWESVPTRSGPRLPSVGGVLQGGAAGPVKVQIIGPHAESVTGRLMRSLHQGAIGGELPWLRAANRIFFFTGDLQI